MGQLTLPHLHLLLNHFPTVGVVVGLGLLLLALIRRSDDLTRAALELFFAIGLLTLPAYLSGVAAEAVIEGRAGVAAAAIEAHHDAALLGFVLMLLTAAAAWLALWQGQRGVRPARGSAWAVLLLALATLALMANAADIGGEIRHPEILAASDAAVTADSGAVGPEWLRSASIKALANDLPWAWPAAETLHFIGLGLLFSVVLVGNLRILGMMKGVPFAALHRLLPWGILGLALNVITGMMFFIGASSQYTENGAFYWKIAFMLVAGGSLLYMTVAKSIWALRPGQDAALYDKAIAASALMLWVAVMYCGSMLPFLGNAF